MKVRVFIVVFAFFTANFLIAQESFPFSDFIAEDGSGIEKLQKLQNEKADKKANAQRAKGDDSRFPLRKRKGQKDGESRQGK